MFEQKRGMVENMENTDKEKQDKQNAIYEAEKAKLSGEEMNFGNMSYYLKKEEFKKKHLWKDNRQIRVDLFREIKRIMG